MSENSPMANSTTKSAEVREAVWDVFLSYAMEDVAWVKELVEHLQVRQLKVLDPFSAPIEFWGKSREEILNTILPAKCRVVLVVLSAAYSKSPFFVSELAVIVEGMRRHDGTKLLPIRLDESTVPDVLRTYATLDARGFLPAHVADTLSAKLQENAISSKVVAQVSDQAQCAQPQAFLHVVMYCQPMLIRNLTRMGLSMSDAEDVMQDAIMKTYLRLQKYPNSILNIPQYLFFVARQSAWDWMLKTRFERRSRSPTALEFMEEPASVLLTQEQTQEVERSIDKLSSPQKELIQMHYLKGMTISEISEQLGLSRATTRTRLYRALATLRQQLKVEV
jgi:RNA polymerase sigma-70 factor, ECF subfamily